jgi:MarR family transcriptional regulator for hemolysin
MNSVLMEERHEFARELVLVARRWRALADERLGHMGLSEGRWAVLHSLREAETGLSQTALAECAQIEPPTLVRLIDGLEKQGLVERRQCPKDRRVNRINLTPAALPLIENIYETLNKLRRESMAGIKEEDLHAANTLLCHLKQNLANA